MNLIKTNNLFSDALLPYLMNALNNHSQETSLELTFRALKFCLQRVNCETVCEIFKTVQEVLDNSEGLDVSNIHSLLILSLAYYLACKIAQKEPSEEMNAIEISPKLAEIYDKIAQENREIFIHRLLILNGWLKEDKTVYERFTLVKAIDEIFDLLTISLEANLTSLLTLKNFEDKKNQDKFANLPLVKEILLDIWDCYGQWRHKKLTNELICHIILTVSGIKDNPCIADTVDRTPLIQSLCFMLHEELSADEPNEQVVQALSTATAVEIGKNFPMAWQSFQKICDKFVHCRANSITRLYMILIAISCHNSHQNLDSRIFNVIFSGLLEKLQRQDMSSLQITKDLMSFLNFLMCPRKSRFLKKVSLEESVFFNFIDILFQLECLGPMQCDMNFRLTCLKTIQDMSVTIAEEKIHHNIIKHLFQRLYEVKWVENLTELMVPSSNHQPQCEKFEISFNIERSILCNAETSQIITHAQGGRGYCQVIMVICWVTGEPTVKFFGLSITFPLLSGVEM